MNARRYAALDREAHLTIYLPEHSLSIVSRGDGFFHLCVGGYGEPVRVTVDEPDGFSELPLTAAIGEMEGVAHEYVKALPQATST